MLKSRKRAREWGRGDTRDSPLFCKVARIALKDLFAPCCYKAPSLCGANLLLDTYHRVTGQPFSCPWCGGSIRYGKFERWAYRDYCITCFKGLTEKDSTWGCMCAHRCVTCGAELAINGLDQPSDYNMPASVLLEIPVH